MKNNKTIKHEIHLICEILLLFLIMSKNYTPIEGDI